MQVNFKEIFKQLQKERGIAPEVLKEALEAALLSAYKKSGGHKTNVRVNLDLESGQWQVIEVREVVEEVEDPEIQLTLAEAQEIDPEAELGKPLETDVTPADFGRLAAQMAKQVITQRLRDAERKAILDQYKTKEGDTIIGTVQRFEGRNIIVSFGKAEGIVPVSEQVPGERFRVGDRIKVLLREVKETPREMQLILSRADAGLVKELFELEVPEVQDGSVMIEAIAREAGYRTKIAVRSKDSSIDPIGACVGARGSRIQSITNELRNEKIDIIRFSADPKEFIANALSPAKAVSVTITPGEKNARVVVPDSQLSLAIGREGQNVRLAARLTGFKIDIKSESQHRQLQADMLSSKMEEITTGES